MAPAKDSMYLVVGYDSETGHSRRFSLRAPDEARARKSARHLGIEPAEVRTVGGGSTHPSGSPWPVVLKGLAALFVLLGGANFVLLLANSTGYSGYSVSEMLLQALSVPVWLLLSTVLVGVAVLIEIRNQLQEPRDLRADQSRRPPDRSRSGSLEPPPAAPPGTPRTDPDE